MITLGQREAYVARRFDQLEARFRDDVAGDDVRLRALVNALTPLDGSRVLDLGCGKGRFARRLQAAGARVVGLDGSPAMLGAAHGIERVRGSARRLPFGDRTFDAVIAVEVLQHCAPLERVLDEARRVLRPGGLLAIIDRNAQALEAKRPWLPALAVKWLDQSRGRWMYPARAPVRERWFHPGQLAVILAARFQQVEVSYLLRPEEAAWAVFRAWPRARSMVCWSAQRGEAMP